MSVTLQQATLNDIKYLNKIRGDDFTELNIEKLSEQDQGKAIYLIALQDGNPVGSIFVKLESSEEYHKSPVLQDLFVSEEMRKQGIGSQIIKEAESYLSELGYKEVGIDCETKDEWIRKMYEKEDFQLKSGPHRQSWKSNNPDENIDLDIFHMEKKIR